MNSYRITDIVDDERMPVYRKVRKDAQTAAKELAAQLGSDARDDIRIQLVSVPTDADAVHHYLNGETPKDLPVLKTWKLSPRGGLVELKADGTTAVTEEQA